MWDIDCVNDSVKDNVNLQNVKYQLCAPDDVVANYKVYVRILGKPGGKLNICVNELQSVLDGDVDPDTICEVGEFSTTRTVGGGGKKEKGGGGSKFQIATGDLFSDEYDDILWSVTTNKDFRIAQFWVFEV